MIVRSIAIPSSSMPFCARSSVVSAKHCPSTRTSVRARHPPRPAVATALRSLPQSPGPLAFLHPNQLFPSQTGVAIRPQGPGCCSRGCLSVRRRQYPRLQRLSRRCCHSRRPMTLHSVHFCSSSRSGSVADVARSEVLVEHHTDAQHAGRDGFATTAQA